MKNDSGSVKLSIGLISAAVASLFFASSVAAAPSASAQSINYSYVTEQELTDAEKELIIRDLPGLAQETDANYYLIYRPATGTASTPSTSTSQVLPNTGSVETGLLEGNARAVAFYEKVGFRFDGVKKTVNLGAERTEYRMIFKQEERENG
ncbi:hypothetical protein ACTGUR_10130 [Streptococcus suis]|uniref:hypothetical protein n=1 Tax=Streptococcus suis TaxID=1307 RepID=UPI000AA1F15C|nr:hypothetical protein [Streptococcus suis]